MTTHHMERLTLASDLAPIVTLAEAKAHLRVSHLAEDALIERYLEGVADYLDGYDGVLGRALRPQSWKLTLDALPCSGVIRLPLAPFVAVTEIKYDTTAGDTLTLDAATYRVRKDQGFGVVEQRPEKSWPSDVVEARVTYSVGHDSANPMPKPIYQAALLLLGDAFDNRSAQVEGKIVSVNPAIERLLAPYRVRSW